MTCVFNDDFAFGTTAFDSEDTEPEWKDIFSLRGGDNTRAGWVYRDGELVPVVSSTKRTVRNFDNLFATACELTIVDALDNTYELRATMSGGSSWRFWPNYELVVCRAQWECNGLVGNGDFQEALQHDYTKRFYRNPSGR
jgi:hypothetical protein